ncbi:calcineurin-like phosphoesterase family protein [Methylocapsa sp. D3K7]|uniref:calcineurin-like phosphoesterase family protein n=1 Tax=Methylocapsa sp. D3K7 TaxID=3041435 RepID=UPI00244EDA6E|nr:calcineurin-like phosphoesterase family protein [Methylocapsa sp. D3K7]WGJ13807.1 calcineurin-like phosphoesterase family protein [Methylocapsa sp. D3K7]
MTSNADLSRRDLMAAAATLAAALPGRNVMAGEQAAPLARGKAGPIVQGIVFESRSGGRQRQAGDPGIGGVLVSNGREVVRTGSDGRYSLPIEDGMAVFVIKPSDYAVPLDKETNLPRFSTIHQPEGTPSSLDLLYPGLAPTGPLPDSVDFALVRSKEPRRFDAVLFTDPQPESNAEIDFIRDDVVAGLNGIEAAFGITAGDIMFDELSLYQRYNAIIGQIGLPWWNIGGNHDLNFESPNVRYCRETYKRVFGANYYAFEYGDVLFMMLDNVDYLGADSAKPRQSGKYRGLFGERQLEFIANVLKETDRARLIAVFMHIPLQNYLAPDEPSMSVADRAKFLALLEGRKTVSFSGHTHTTEHHYFGATEGFMGSVPHHHHVLTAVSGSWWSGPLDRRGIASADSRDGTPHGFHILSIDGGAYTTRFVPANEPNGRQMRISLDANPRFGTDVFRDFRAGQLRGSPLRKDELASVTLVVNVFDGGPKTTVAYTIGASAPVPMKREARPDPFVVEVFGRNKETVKPWVKAEPSSHIWAARLPASLDAGAHAIDVHVVDEYGREHRDGLILEVMG